MGAQKVIDMNAKDLRDNSAAELKEEETRLRKELFDIEFKHGTRQLTDTASLRRLRRDLARLLTVLAEKTRLDDDAQKAA